MRNRILIMWSRPSQCKWKHPSVSGDPLASQPRLPPLSSSNEILTPTPCPTAVLSGGPVERWHVYHLLSFSRSVMSDSLWPHGLQHARLPCPSPSSGACSNSCPLSQWCHPTNSFSVIRFSSCLQSFPSSGSFLMSWLFTSGGQSIYHHWVVKRRNTHPYFQRRSCANSNRHSLPLPHPERILVGAKEETGTPIPAQPQWEAPPWVSMEADELPH